MKILSLALFLFCSVSFADKALYVSPFSSLTSQDCVGLQAIEKLYQATSTYRQQKIDDTSTQLNNLKAYNLKNEFSRLAETYADLVIEYEADLVARTRFLALCAQR